MPDQIIDADMARSVQADAALAHPLSAWIVTGDDPWHPEKFVARLATSEPTLYVLLADTLAELQAKLPPGLVRLSREPNDPLEVVEVWFSP